MMRAMRLLAIPCLVLAAGCAATGPAPDDARALTGPSMAEVSAPPSRALIVAPEPPRSETKPDANPESAPPVASRNPPHEPSAPREPVAPSAPREPVAPSEPAAAREPAAIATESPAHEAAAAAAAAHPDNQSDAGAAPPPAKAAAKIPAARAPTGHAPADAAPVPAAKALEPPLDVAALKLRLRNTKAIGVFAKLALSNQVDDLMQQFRAHYLSGQNASVASLRQPFDMLILKVLALIQDSDPSLAKTISGSREAIWGILADPVKFDAAS
jgi:hypothetical protein